VAEGEAVDAGEAVGAAVCVGAIVAVGVTDSITTGVCGSEQPAKTNTMTIITKHQTNLVILSPFRFWICDLMKM
jgi:hypothetical protein